MCGRFACTLPPKTLCCTSCPNATNGRIAPAGWCIINKDVKGCEASYPNCNLAPTSHVPVICNARQLMKAGFELQFENKCENNSSDLIGVPMYWSLIPKFFKDTLKNFRLTTNNCRFESILEKPMFSTPLRKGNRCLIVCDAYYEWQKEVSGGKQPFMIYRPQKVSWWEREDQIPEEHLPMLLAGIYEVNDFVTRPHLFASVSVVTVDSAPTPTGIIHDRMPAVFSSVDDALLWIDPSTPSDAAVHLLKPCSDVTFHMVSKSVNTVQNKAFDLCKPVNNIEEKKPIRGFMDSWLIKSSTSPTKRRADAPCLCPLPEKIVKDEKH